MLEDGDRRDYLGNWIVLIRGLRGAGRPEAARRESRASARLGRHGTGRWTAHRRAADGSRAGWERRPTRAGTPPLRRSDGQRRTPGRAGMAGGSAPRIPSSLCSCARGTLRRPRSLALSFGAFISGTRFQRLFNEIHEQAHLAGRVLPSRGKRMDRVVRQSIVRQ